VIRLLRLAVFALVLSAEVYLVIVLGDRFTPANHFSYFTVLSNVFAALVLLAGAFRPVPDGVRGAAMLYMVTTGIVYAVLLRGADVQTPAYANWVLHVVVPILVIIDWILDPPMAPIAVRTTVSWLGFPLVYLVYTLLRGPVVGWYPYPFLDPRVNGYGTVALLTVFVAITIGLLAWLLAWMGTRGTRRVAG
jgi:hypothetical protein